MLAPAHPDGQRDSDTASFFHVQDCSTLPQSGNSSFESGDQHATRRESGVAAFVRPALRSLLARKKGEAVQNITTCKLSALPMRREVVRPLMNGKGNDQGAAIGCSVLTFKFCPWDGNEFKVSDSACSVCGSQRMCGDFTGRQGEVLSKLLLPPWERVLWQAQPYDDNYTDRTFLQSLITNENFSEYDFWRIVRDSVVVTQHLSATVIFLAMFYLTNYCYVQLRWMLFVDVLLGAAGCAAMILTTMYKSWSDSGLPSLSIFVVRMAKGLTPDKAVSMSAKYIRAWFLFLTAIYTLSPILRTLTETISNDTVAAMTISFLTLHLFSHDYRFVNGRDAPFSGSVSLNAAMFVSVLLTSRSASNLHVALLMCCAVEIFALAPRVFRQIRLTSETAFVTVTVVFFVFALILLQKLNALLAFIFALSVFSITFICPLTFMYIQRYKNKINGPWDEAVPTSKKNDKMGR